MLPQYHLIKGLNECAVLGFEEWSDLIPSPDGTVPIKPLYVSPHPGNGAPARAVAGTTLWDLKRCRGESGTGHVPERRLAVTARRAGLEAEIDAVTSLAFVPQSAVAVTWSPVPWEARRHRLAPGTFDVIERLLADIYRYAELSAAECSPWAIGSLLYDESFGDHRDVDLAIALAPDASSRLREAIARLRTERRELAPAAAPFSYAYTLCLPEIAVDLFPALPRGIQHPIAGAKNWRLTGKAGVRRCVVEDVAWSSYSFPLLRVSTSPHWLLICSNAFRGAFWRGQHLEVAVREMLVERGAASDLTIDVVIDPVCDIAGGETFLDYENDRNWIM